MSNTPLYDTLCVHRDAAPAPFHMPGHHGTGLPVPELSPLAGLDVTEIPGMGNLFAPGGPIEEAESLWATAFGQKSCLFLTGGSTQGLHSALTLASSIGGGLLVDRNCHRSVYNSMALLDLQPTYLSRPWLEGEGILGAISPQSVDEALTNHPEIKTVCITSPTYHGVLSDIPAIAQVVHRHGGTLIVDGAHGAHLPFLGENPFQGADLLVCSAHKTLSALGQTALLFSSTYSLDRLCWAGSLYGSSSPSYPMMASLDVCRAYMEGAGKVAYLQVAQQVAQLRQRYPALKERDGLVLDPCRFVLTCDQSYQAKAQLEALGIYPEMADAGHVVFILTDADSTRQLSRLTQALDSLSLQPLPAVTLPALPSFPPVIHSPRTALFASRRSCVLAQAEGEISAVQVAPYPPGVPIIAPGEEILKKHLSYLSEIGYNINETVDVVEK